MRTIDQFVVHDHTASNTSAETDQSHRSIANPCAEPVVRGGERLHVVRDRRWQSGRNLHEFGERHLVPAKERGAHDEGTPAGDLNVTGETDPDRGDPRIRDSKTGDDVGHQTYDRVHIAGPECMLLAVQDRSAQVGQRDVDRVTGELEPDEVRGAGAQLEQLGRPAATGERTCVALRDEAEIDERPGQPGQGCAGQAAATSQLSTRPRSMDEEVDENASLRFLQLRPRRVVDGFVIHDASLT